MNADCTMPRGQQRRAAMGRSRIAVMMSSQTMGQNMSNGTYRAAPCSNADCTKPRGQQLPLWRCARGPNDARRGLRHESRSAHKERTDQLRATELT